MNEERKLQLVFITDNNKNFTLNIDEPKEPYSPQDIKEAMTTIINNNIIEGKNGSLVAIKGAYFVSRTVEEITLPE
ncbi:MAG TPA: DUF2922 domain-containing protein [Haloplasmataceae bacterium]